jgi:hypothetical protein
MERREPHRFSPNPAILTLPSRKPTEYFHLLYHFQCAGNNGSAHPRRVRSIAGLLVGAPERDLLRAGRSPDRAPPGKLVHHPDGARRGRPVSARTESIIPVPSRPWITAGCRRHLPAGDEGHRGPPGNSAMRGHDPRRAHAIPAPARFAAVSRLQRRDGAHPRDPAGRIPLRTTHLRVPRVQRCRYPSSPMKPLAAAPRLVPMPLVRTAARSPAG